MAKVLCLNFVVDDEEAEMLGGLLNRVLERELGEWNVVVKTDTRDAKSAENKALERVVLMRQRIDEDKEDELVDEYGDGEDFMGEGKQDAFMSVVSGRFRWVPICPRRCL